MPSFGGGHAAGDEGGFDLGAFEKFFDAEQVLGGEYFGRSHDGGLGLVGDGEQGGIDCDDGFAGADVALEEAVHWG